MNYRVPARVLRAQLDDDEVMLNPDTGMYHLLGDGGSQIVAAIETGSNVAGIVESIAKDADVPPERVRRDVDAFITALVERGLLEEVESS